MQKSQVSAAPERPKPLNSELPKPLNSVLCATARERHGDGGQRAQGLGVPREMRAFPGGARGREEGAKEGAKEEARERKKRRKRRERGRRRGGGGGGDEKKR